MRDKDNGVSIFLFTRSMRSSISLGGFVVKRARRLVAQQDVGVFDYRPADGRSLLLAAGKLRGRTCHGASHRPSVLRISSVGRGLVGKIRADLDVFP